MTTSSVPVNELEPGDEYVIRAMRRGVSSLESRTVLGVISRAFGTFGGALLEVRDDSGNVHRSHMYGSVDVVSPAPVLDSPGHVSGITTVLTSVSGMEV